MDKANSLPKGIRMDGKSQGQEGIREPLIANSLAVEGGASEAVNASGHAGSSLADSVLNEATTGRKMDGVPTQIPISHQALTELNQNENCKNFSETPYKIIKQAAFDLPTSTVTSDSVDLEGQGNFKTDVLGKELEKIEEKMYTEMSTIGGLKVKPEYQHKLQNKSLFGFTDTNEAYMNVYDDNYYDPKRNRPNYDANMGEEFLESYLKKFSEEIGQEKYHVSPNFGDEGYKKLTFDSSSLSIMTKLKELKDHDDGKMNDNADVVHRSLICSKDFMIKDWMIEVRKTFYHESKNINLELGQVS